MSTETGFQQGIAELQDERGSLFGNAASLKLGAHGTLHVQCWTFLVMRLR